MFVLILKPQTNTRLIACVFFSTNNLWINQWSLHVCSFHKPHVDPLQSLHVCYFHKPHMDQPLESLHMCYFHKPHMDQPLESLHVCSYTKTTTRVIASVFFSQTTHRSTTRVIACVLLPQTTHGCTRLSACVFCSTNNLWINQRSLHVYSFHKPHVDRLESLHVCSYTKNS